MAVHNMRDVCIRGVLTLIEVAEFCLFSSDVSWAHSNNRTIANHSFRICRVLCHTTLALIANDKPKRSYSALIVVKLMYVHCTLHFTAIVHMACFLCPQPSLEHLLPVHFAIGAAGDDEGEVLYDQPDGAMGWGNYRFGHLESEHPGEQIL